MTWPSWYLCYKIGAEQELPMKKLKDLLETAFGPQTGGQGYHTCADLVLSSGCVCHKGDICILQGNSKPARSGCMQTSLTS